MQIDLTKKHSLLLQTTREAAHDLGLPEGAVKMKKIGALPQLVAEIPLTNAPEDIRLYQAYMDPIRKDRKEQKNLAAIPVEPELLAELPQSSGSAESEAETRLFLAELRAEAKKLGGKYPATLELLIRHYSEREIAAHLGEKSKTSASRRITRLQGIARKLLS